jgi:hypothetical protein
MTMTRIKLANQLNAVWAQGEAGKQAALARWHRDLYEKRKLPSDAIMAAFHADHAAKWHQSSLFFRRIFNEEYSQ